MGTHIYRHQGVRIPSVTMVLAWSLYTDWSFVPRTLLEEACARGQRIHTATEYWDLGSPLMVLETVRTEEEAACVNAWSMFCVNMQFKPYRSEAGIPIGIEERVLLENEMVGGCLDRRGTVRGNERWIVDIKTGAPHPSHGPQLWAYSRGLGRDWWGARKFGVYLKPNHYHLVEYPERRDWNAFQNAAATVHWRLTHRLVQFEQVPDNEEYGWLDGGIPIAEVA